MTKLKVAGKEKIFLSNHAANDSRSGSAEPSVSPDVEITETSQIQEIGSAFKPGLTR
jgi:hypothetical protein